MDTGDLEAEYAGLILSGFDELAALRLGQILVDMALAKDLPLVIDIRTADRTLFHVGLPGSAPLNDLWAHRKSNSALLFQLPSLLIGRRNLAKNEALARHGLSTEDYAEAGGAVPIRVAGVGVVAVATVSGLPQVEDHGLVVQALRALIAEGQSPKV